jgi:hypothetical protein
MKIKICIIGMLLAFNLSGWAALYEFGTSAGGSALGTIPDNSTIGTSGLSGTYFTASGLNWSISDLTLTFVLQGGDSSDLSGYLRLGSSDYYDLTPLIQGPSLSGGHTYTIDFNDTGFQSVFYGQNPNNTWTLFFADTVNGDTTTPNGWSLDVTAVPEPANIALGVFGIIAIGGMAWRRYRQES